jgi:IclR family transcriptional regulator, acetate operon repressor
MSEDVQSVVRAVEVLDALRVGGPLGVSDLAAELELPIATTHRIARTLVSQGLVAQLRDRRYGLGSRLVPLGMAANRRLGARARPVLAELAQHVGESANLATFAAGGVEYVSQVAGPQSMRMFTEVGRRAPMHSTGVGKAMLALMDDRDVRTILTERGMASSTATTITDPDRMLEELARIRRQGYAIDEGEMEVGVRCVAVAFDSVGPMAVSVSGPSSRLVGPVLDDAVPRVVAAAARLAHLFTTE